MTLAPEHQEVDFTDVQFEKTWYCVMRDKEAKQSQPNCHKSFKSTAEYATWLVPFRQLASLISESLSYTMLSRKRVLYAFYFLKD